MPASWFPPRLCSHTSLPVFTPALVLLLSCSWPWEGEVGIPVQPNSARTELCHRSPCDLEFLCPSSVSSPSVSLQKQVCNATYSTKHPIPALAFVLCVPAFPQSWCLSPCSQLSTSLQSITLGRRRWGQGRGELVMHALPSRLCSFFFCLFLTCLILVFLFSDPLSSEYLWPSATPGFRVPKEREECENLAVLQSIVLLYNTVPFSPLSFFSLSLSSSCNPAEIQTVRVWFCLRACFACEVYVD